MYAFLGKFRRVGQNIAVLQAEADDDYDFLFETAFKREWIPKISSVTTNMIRRYDKRRYIIHVY